MDINLTGKLYVHFIKSVFENNKKIGSEIVINPSKSDFLLIDGLNRIKVIKNNKIIITNDNILCGLNTYLTKYIGEFNFNYHTDINDQTNLQLTKFSLIEKDKVNTSQMNNKIFINNYSTKKYNVVNDIMEIINN